MSTRIYTLPVEQTRWEVPGGGATTVFNWEYDEPRANLLNLYEKGKNKQWNTSDRLDWSIAVPLDNPLGTPDQFVAIYGSPVWDKMNEKERAAVRLHGVAWQFSQFLHGEQGALICTAQIVQTVPDVDAKFYAATQVMDEARHVETYSRYLHEKLGVAYPINPHLKTLLDQAITDPRWDFTYLAMQILIEGLALAAFGLIRDVATEPLAKALNAYVMQDEARHVAFGRLALRDYYPQLTQKERDEREEFTVEACYLMRDRFRAEEVWRNLDVNPDECLDYIDNSEGMVLFRRLLFSRIVPTLKDIGLWGPKVQGAFEEMGVIDFAAVDPVAKSEEDERVAEAMEAELKAKREAAINQTIVAGASA